MPTPPPTTPAPPQRTGASSVPGNTVPPPEQTRPAGTSDVVANQPAPFGPWRSDPRRLFDRAVGAPPVPTLAPPAPASSAPASSAPDQPFYRRPSPAISTTATARPDAQAARTPIPPAPVKPPKKSALGLLALWEDAPRPLFRTGPAPSPATKSPVPGPETVTTTNTREQPGASATQPVRVPRPDPAATRPAETQDVVAAAPAPLGPWRGGPRQLFGRAGPSAPAPQPKPDSPTNLRQTRSPTAPDATVPDATTPVLSSPAPAKVPPAAPRPATPASSTTVTRATTRPTLVTGATGFVGSAVARALLAEGHTLRLLVRPGTNRDNLDGLQADIAEGDLTDAASLTAALAGCRYLVHVAADYRLWVPDPARMHAINVDGTRTLLQAARDAGVERIVYCSSVAALGLDGDGTPGTEQTPVERESIIGAYKQSKYDAEQLVRAMAADGLPVVIVAPSAPVGPRDRKPTPTGKMILDAAAGRMPAYVETGLNIVHVDDVARGHVLALQHGVVGETYILGGEDLGMAHLLAMIDDVMGRPPQHRTKLSTGMLQPVAFGSELKARIFGTEPRVTREMLAMAEKQMFYSSAKATEALGYSARPARQAVADAIAWYRQAGMLKVGMP